jgi:hypothetical protein
MPTISVQVGQCGNQLGNTFWSLLQQQQEQLGNGLLAREWFAERHNTSSSSSGEPVLHPRLISVDSEAKVARGWSSNSSSSAPHQLHILGHAGCGNNWWARQQAGAAQLQGMLVFSSMPSYASFWHYVLIHTFGHAFTITCTINA